MNTQRMRVPVWAMLVVGSFSGGLSLAIGAVSIFPSQKQVDKLEKVVFDRDSRIEKRLERIEDKLDAFILKNR